MGKSKFEFISELLASKNLEPALKQKFFALVAMELQIEDASYKSITARLEKLERQLGANSESIPEPEPMISEQIKLTKYIDPSGLSKFLIAYNQDSFLKYTCHCIDDETIIQEINTACSVESYCLEKHQKLLAGRFRNLISQFEPNYKLRYLIQGYLTGLGGKGEVAKWSTDSITTNWHSEGLRKWSLENPGLVPHPGVNLMQKYRYRGYKLDKPFKSYLNGNRISSFSDLVIHFKNLFHLRGDNSLRDLIDHVNKASKWNDKINFIYNDNDFLKNLELFADVDKLIQTYRGIIEMILDVVDRFKLPKPSVAFKFKQDGGFIYFCIHHTNTIFKKTIDDLLNRPGEKETLLINNRVNGLCELHIRADFGNGTFAEVNLWDGNERRKIEISQFSGVEYILKFIK